MFLTACPVEPASPVPEETNALMTVFITADADLCVLSGMLDLLRSFSVPDCLLLQSTV